MKGASGNGGRGDKTVRLLVAGAGEAGDAHDAGHGERVAGVEQFFARADLEVVHRQSIADRGVEIVGGPGVQQDLVGAYLPNGETRAYPLPKIYYHEVVNDEAGDMPFAAVY